MTRLPGDREHERGQVIILFAAALILILGAAALVVDVGLLRVRNQTLWNALDAGALAGVTQLPGNGAAAENVAREYVRQNDPGTPAGNITASFRCLVGDRDRNGQPDLLDIGVVCHPGIAAAWTCRAAICGAVCSPAAGHTCNTLVLTGQATVKYGFGPAVGVPSGTTATVTSAACRGPCGEAPSKPIDLVMIIDRSSSMSSGDITNVKDAARAVLLSFDPAVQWVGLGLLGPSSTASGCSGANTPALGVPATTTTGSVTWLPVGLSGHLAPVNQPYLEAGGALRTSSVLVKAINCFTQSSTGTILSVPVDRARTYLQANGRAGVTKGIILMTDGQPNGDTCLASYNAATAAKALGIEVFTIGFGVGASVCPDGSGAFVGRPVTYLLARMASDSVDNGCVATENTDGDHFFCQPKSGDLASVFTAAATALVAGSRLVQLP